jgi:diacylglycerol kinase (ATP)
LTNEPAQRSFLAGFGHAIDGLLEALDGGRNLKVHLVSGILVAMVGSGVELRVSERIALLLCVGLVIAAEVFNTAVEALVDLATDELVENARLAKDAAAGAVLVLAALSALVLGLVVTAEWPTISQEGPRIAHQVGFGLPLALLAALLLSKSDKSRALDLVATAAGAAILTHLSFSTASMTFTLLAALLFAICVATASRRRRAGLGVELPPGR